jgi:Na+/glutamate symporter
VEQHETFRSDLAGMVGLMPQIQTVAGAAGLALLAAGIGMGAAAGVGLLPAGLVLAGLAGLILPAWLKQQQTPETRQNKWREQRKKALEHRWEERMRRMHFANSA